MPLHCGVPRHEKVPEKPPPPGFLTLKLPTIDVSGVEPGPAGWAPAMQGPNATAMSAIPVRSLVILGEATPRSLPQQLVQVLGERSAKGGGNRVQGGMVMRVVDADRER